MFENKDFKKVSINDYFDVVSGGTPSKKNKIYWEPNQVNWIGSNMCQNKIIYESDGKYISFNGLKHSSAKILPINTILVALVGATIGKTALLKFETSTNQNIAGLIIKKEFVPEYVFYALQSKYNEFLASSPGTFKIASVNFVRNLNLIKPPMELQNKFASFVELIDKQKFLFENIQYQKLKYNLIEKLFVK